MSEKRDLNLDRDEESLCRHDHSKAHKTGTVLVKTIVGLFLIAVGATLFWLPPSEKAVGFSRFGDWSSNLLSNSTPAPAKKNVILMVSDGMGPTSLSLTRSFRQHVNKLPYNDILNLDKHFIGHSRTRPSSSLITDSAAGATAFSCAKKSYNGAIAVLDDESSCGTVLEGAKLNGYLTGLVVRTSITDATPAAFAAHAQDRSMQDLIAEHELGIGHPLGRSVDLLMGGGLCHFLPNSHKHGCRQDDRDLVKYAKKHGWNVAMDLKELKHERQHHGANQTLPALALFAPTDMPWEIDHSAPTLADMTQEALALMGSASDETDQSFFMLIEGSRIDHAGHSNDPSSQVREVLAYDEAFKIAVEFAKSRGDTVVISTSDHETGGLTAGRQVTKEYPEYVWYPEVLANVDHSTQYLANELAVRASQDKKDVEEFIEKVLEPSLGFDLNKHEKKRIKKHAHNAQDVLADIVSTHAHVGWTTHGHTAVDVNVYAYGADELRGSNENTDIGKFLEEYLGVDLDSVTKKISGIRNKQ